MTKLDISVFKNEDDETRLRVIRSEVQPYISRVEGYATVVRTKLSQDEETSENAELIGYLDEVIEAIENIAQIISVLTSFPNPPIED